MSIYTSYDMIVDCRAGKPEGWIWFVRNLVPACRRLIMHYGGDEEAVRRFVAGSQQWLPQEEAAPVREMLVRWRDRLLASAGYPAASAKVSLTLEDLTEAFPDLTPLERMMFWLETMGYGDAQAAAVLHVAEEAVQRAREKAANLLRSRLDDWSRTMPRDSGAALGEAARAAIPEEPVTFRQYIEIIDGRLTWTGRQEVDRKLSASWHEVDHFCRVREMDDALTRATPFSDAEAQVYLDLLKVRPPKPSLWKRMLAGK